MDRRSRLSFFLFPRVTGSPPKSSEMMHIKGGPFTGKDSQYGPSAAPHKSPLLKLSMSRSFTLFSAKEKPTRLRSNSSFTAKSILSVFMRAANTCVHR
eukprot:scaffold2557_cov139-Skeletonema_marinoi.AAC.22